MRVYVSAGAVGEGGAMTTAVSGARAFNGLTGAEIRTRILQEIAAKLTDDTRLAGHLVFPVVTWKWTLELATQPAPGILKEKDDGVVRTEVAGRVTIEGEAGVAAAGREAALADPRGGRPFRSGAEAGTRAGGGAGAPVAPVLEARLGRLEQLLDQLLTKVVEAPAGTVPTGTPEVPGVVTTTTTAGGHHPDVLMVTGTGLPIVGGAKPSPGAGLADSFGGGSAVGAVQVSEPLAAVGVTHPPLEEGGVGAPDAVRRAAGLPVPQMQVVPGGGVVDLPAGSF
jgi:hypothetical protein